MVIVFEVLGEPRGKARPRFTRTGHTYTPSTTVEYENAVIRAYAERYGDRFYDKGTPLSIEVTAYYGIPKSTSKKRRTDMLSGAVRPTKKPDCDNVLKIIADALNKVAYADDAQIVRTEVTKLYSDVPRVVVRIDEVQDELTIATY